MEISKFKLSDKFCKYLENLPEQGMGYQIVDIELFGGKVLVNRIVFNSTYLKLEKEEKLKQNQIKDIKIKLPPLSQ